MKKWLIGIFLCASFGLFGQEIKPKVYFLQDTMQLAEPVQLAFSVTYPKELSVVFPDSTFNYFPFEFRDKVYFTTKSDSLTSTDSAVYTLASFELEPVQTLALPVFVLKGKDSLNVFSQRDSIFFQERILENFDSLQAISTVHFVEVEEDFNYPYLFIGIGVLILVLSILVYLFGSKLWLKWRIYRLSRFQARFMADFRSKISADANIEKLFYQWKKHNEQISQLPLSKLTVSELLKVFQDTQLKEHLNKVNRRIYSSHFQEDISDSMHYLLEYSVIIFDNRIKQLRNDRKG